MKFKGIISIVVIICMLFSVQCISIFAGNGSEPTDDVITVNLKGTWSDYENEVMTTTDNINFTLSLNLTAGSYQFVVEKNSTTLSHTTTMKDTTISFARTALSLRTQ